MDYQLGARPNETKIEQPDFMSIGLQKLERFSEAQAELEDLLQDIKSVCGEKNTKKVNRLSADLAEFEPSITMIGQIKAGKTSLVNAMVGRSDLLPADVNPWTSVVTSLHLNTPQEPDAPKASFQFFDRVEWDHLIQNGGRIGELSMRAGADEELQKVHEQITTMCEKTQARLGKKFELLLGQRHNYKELDDDLVQRYVCLGDDFEEMSLSEQQGQFADITKSADLYIDAPAIPVPLCIRDTPGVNDTFMVREQITIQSLRKSKICVVVLSASQALSSVDMGLIRLISNVQTRKIVIFVNRIDELADPINQLQDVGENIASTLAAHNGPEDVEIVFGSAYWANLAMSDTLDEIQEDSAKALAICTEHLISASTDKQDARSVAWQLSGVPHLFAALADRIDEGEGARKLEGVRSRARNLVSGLIASNQLTSLRLDRSEVEVMEPAAVTAQLDKLESDLIQKLDSDLDRVFENFSSRLDRSHGRFLTRAVESLLQHLEVYGENEVWQYSPEGLRLLVRSGYQVMRTNVTSACDNVYMDAAQRLNSVYRKALSVDVDNFEITPPKAPEIPAPISLGQTIAMDLQTSWWKGWWKRRKGYRAFASGFHDLIEAETAPIIDDLKITQAAEIRTLAMERLKHFLSEQRGILVDITEMSKISLEDLNRLFGITAQQELMETMKGIIEELSDEEEDAQDSDESLSEGAAA